MQTMTSAYANKMLKSLEEDKAFWVNKEATSSTYVAAINEEPVVPEYDYTEVVATITSLDEKIAIIKHALNVTNSNEKVRVGDAEMSIDTNQCLIRCVSSYQKPERSSALICPEIRFRNIGILTMTWS